MLWSLADINADNAAWSAAYAAWAGVAVTLLIAIGSVIWTLVLAKRAEQGAREATNKETFANLAREAIAQELAKQTGLMGEGVEQTKRLADLEAAKLAMERERTGIDARLRLVHFERDEKQAFLDMRIINMSAERSIHVRTIVFRGQVSGREVEAVDGMSLSYPRSASFSLPTSRTE